jgi:prepilin-type N-terminal cleavage/methylation domain-containing protein/prepilin-type processing-associated H-X9-DG protein
MLGQRFQYTFSARRQRGGFTLVEILVAIGILVVLVAITVPVVSRARHQANRTKCANTLRGLGQAVTAFASEHNTTLPTCGIKTPPTTGTDVYPTSTDWIVWGGIDNNVNSDGRNTDYMNESGLAKYLGVTALDQSGGPNERLRSNFRCASVSDDLRAIGPYPYDYQFNSQLSGMPLDRIQNGGGIGMIVETDNRDDSTFNFWATGTYPTDHAGVDVLSSRHGGRGDNCLYIDGHVDAIDSKLGPTATVDGDFKAWDAYYLQSPVTETQTKNTTYLSAK